MARFDKFTVKSREAVQAAQSLADQHDHQALEPEHLLVALLQQQDGVVGPILARLGVPTDAVRRDAEAELAKLPGVRGGGGQYLGPRLAAIFKQAQQEADRLKDDFVSAEHLLVAIAQETDGAAGRVLKAHGVTPDAVWRALQEIRGNQRVTDENPEAKYQALDRYARDLTEAARKGKLDPVIGRDEEIRRVIQVLSRRTKNNPVLIGEPGVGKTAIVEGLAQRIVSEDVPDSLRDRRVISLDIGARYALLIRTHVCLCIAWPESGSAFVGRSTASVVPRPLAFRPSAECPNPCWRPTTSGCMRRDVFTLAVVRPWGDSTTTSSPSSTP